MPSSLPGAIICFALATLLLLMVLLTLIFRTTTPGTITYRSNTREVAGAETGILVVAAVALAILGAALIPKSEDGDSSKDSQSSHSTSSSSTGTKSGPLIIGPGSPTESVESDPTFSPDTESPTVTTNTSSEETATETEQRRAETFIEEYTRYVKNNPLTPQTIADWFVFPVDWYSDKELTDRQKLIDDLKPVKDNGTRYSNAQVVGFSNGPGPQQVTLYINIDYVTAAQKPGTVRVKYILERSDSGQPFRIRSASEQPVGG